MQEPDETEMGPAQETCDICIEIDQTEPKERHDLVQLYVDLVYRLLSLKPHPIPLGSVEFPELRVLLLDRSDPTLMAFDGARDPPQRLCLPIRKNPSPLDNSALRPEPALLRNELRDSALFLGNRGAFFPQILAQIINLAGQLLLTLLDPQVRYLLLAVAGDSVKTSYGLHHLERELLVRP